MPLHSVYYVHLQLNTIFNNSKVEIFTLATRRYHAEQHRYDEENGRHFLLSPSNLLPQRGRLVMRRLASRI